MGIFFRFISTIYLRSFFIIFSALMSFYVIVDLLVNFKELPSSANIILLYICFLIASGVYYILALSLIFAFILFMINLIRSNELVSFYALGFSKNKLVIYPFIWAFILSSFYIFLNFTPFAYFNEYKDNIRKHGTIIQKNKGVFIKYNNSFVYINNIKPFSSTLEGIKILDFKEHKLKYIISAKKAYFKDNDWILTAATKVSFDLNLSLNSKPPILSKSPTIKALKGFEPQFIENISQNSSYSILDAISSMSLFNEQGLDTRHLKVDLYNLIFTPFFAPFFIVIIYYFFPIITRFFNLLLLSFSFFTSTLFAWAFLLFLIKLSKNGVLSPIIGIAFPIFLVIFYACFSFYKNKG